MSPRYDDEWVGRMLNVTERLGPNDPKDLLIKAGLGEAQTVIDLGCGPGLFTLPCADVVGSSGSVYAIGTEHKMLDLINERAAGLGLHNVKTVLTDGGSVPLADNIADYAICGLILHDPQDFEGRVDMARDVARLLRPGGQILIIERAPEPGESQGHRLAVEEAKSILREAGLAFGEARTLVADNYMMVATAKDSA